MKEIQEEAKAVLGCQGQTDGVQRSGVIIELYSGMMYLTTLENR